MSGGICLKRAMFFANKGFRTERIHEPIPMSPRHAMFKTTVASLFSRIADLKLKYKAVLIIRYSTKKRGKR